MIGPEDAPYIYVYKDYYKILSMIHDYLNYPIRILDGVKVKKVMPKCSITIERG
jgi:hypothetical protein